MTKRVRVFALTVTALVIATATLTPGTEGLHPAASISCRIRYLIIDMGLPYKSAPLGLEFLANIVMFAPLGLFIGLLWWPRWRGLLFTIPPLVSLGIETFQFLFLPNRGPQFEDIVANTLGGWLGLGGFALAFRISTKTRTTVSTTGALSKGFGTTVLAPTLDAVAWGVAIALTGLLRSGFQEGRVSWRGEFCLWLVVVGLQVVIGWLLEVYPPGRLRLGEETSSLIIGTLGVGTVGWILTLFWGPALGAPMSLMVVATPLALMVMLSARYVREAALASRGRDANSSPTTTARESPKTKHEPRNK